MAKLIGILAASLGGGLVLGAGIRLGEQLVQQGEGGAGKLSARLGQLEGRMSRLEAAGGGERAAGSELRGIESRIEEQAAAVSAVQVQVEAGAKQVETLGQTGEQLRAEFRSWVEQRLDERLRGVETKLRQENDEAQREMLNAVVESVQNRVIQRISRLEEEVAGQAAGMQELRDCTMRTEQSMHKLLGGIERLIASQGARTAEVEPRPESAAAATTEPGAEAGVAPAPPAAGLPSFETHPRPRRSSIFG